MKGPLEQYMDKSAFTVKDSGQRQSFDSGMVRDTQEGKVDHELIYNGPMADRWAEHLSKGAAKYKDPRPGVPNWTLAAGQEELVRFRKSAVRHFRQWLRGDTDEDHAAATFFNINGYEYVKAKMNVGRVIEYTGKPPVVQTKLGDFVLKQEKQEPGEKPWVCPDCGASEADDPGIRKAPCRSDYVKAA